MHLLYMYTHATIPNIKTSQRSLKTLLSFFLTGVFFSILPRENLLDVCLIFGPTRAQHQFVTNGG